MTKKLKTGLLGIIFVIFIICTTTGMAQGYIMGKQFESPNVYSSPGFGNVMVDFESPYVISNIQTHMFPELMETPAMNIFTGLVIPNQTEILRTGEVTDYLNLHFNLLIDDFNGTIPPEAKLYLISRDSVLRLKNYSFAKVAVGDIFPNVTDVNAGKSWFDIINDWIFGTDFEAKYSVDFGGLSVGDEFDVNLLLEFAEIEGSNFILKLGVNSTTYEFNYNNGTLASNVVNDVHTYNVETGSTWTDGVASIDGVVGKYFQCNDATNTYPRSTSPDLFANAYVNSTGLTLCTWMRTAETRELLFFNNENWMGLGINDAGWSNQVRYLTDGGSITSLYSGVSNLGNDGEWHHTCVTRNATSGYSSSYFDGAFVGTKTMGSPNFGATSGRYFTACGSSVGTDSAPMTADVDESMFFNRTLTSSEISDLYDENLLGNHFTGDTNGLSLYWQYEDNVTDQSGNGVSARDATVLGTDPTPYAGDTIYTSWRLDAEDTNVNGYVSADATGDKIVFADSPNFHFASGEDFTMQITTRTSTAGNTNYALFVKGYDTTTQHLPWYGIFQDEFSALDGFTGGMRSSTSLTYNVKGELGAGELANNTWRAITFMRNCSAGTNGEVYLLIDGVLKATTVLADCYAIGNNVDPLALGVTYNRYHQADYDEWYLYNQSFSVDEILEDNTRRKLHLPSNKSTDNLRFYASFDSNINDEANGAVGAYSSDSTLIYKSSDPTFPNKTYLVASDGGLDIIDNSTGKLWDRDTSTMPIYQVIAQEGSIYVENGANFVNKSYKGDSYAATLAFKDNLWFNDNQQFWTESFYWCRQNTVLNFTFNCDNSTTWVHEKTSILGDSNGNTYVGSEDEGIRVYDSSFTHVSSYNTSNILGGNNVSDMDLNDDTLYVGVVDVAIQVINITTNTLMDSWSSFLPSLKITSLSYGSLLAGFVDAGAIAFDTLFFTAPSFVPGNPVQNISFLEDGFNNSINLTPSFLAGDNPIAGYDYEVNDTNLTISINNGTGIVTVSSLSNWYGSALMNFTAVDSSDISSDVSNNALAKVTPINDNPIIILPTVTIPINDSTVLNLSLYTTDPDNLTGEFIWYVQNEGNPLIATCNITGNILNVSTDFTEGQTTCTINVTDSIGWGSDIMDINVTGPGAFGYNFSETGIEYICIQW